MKQTLRDYLVFCDMDNTLLTAKEGIPSCNRTVIKLFTQLGGRFTSWGEAPGWQREIALWNVGLIAAVSAVLVRGSLEGMKLMTLQCTVLCWCLGLNHLLALVQDFSLSYGIHLLGVLEVLLLGGIWGTFLLIKGRK